MLKPLKNKYTTLRIQLLMFVVISATILNGVFFFTLMEQNRLSQKLKERYEGATMLTRRALDSMKDAELGQRGYIITGDEKYLAPYHMGSGVLHRLDGQMDSLSRTGFGKTYSAELKKLMDEIRGKREELARTISLKSEHRDAATLRVVNTDEGERDMVRIRAICTHLLDAFANGIAIEEQKIEATLLNRQLSVILFSALVIVAVGVMRVKILQRDRRNNSLFKAMEVQNTELVKHQRELVLQQTELKNLSMDFSSRNAELEHFTHIISHDLRGPLANIVSLIEILDEQELSAESVAVFNMLKNASTGLFLRLDDLIILLRKNKGGLLLKERILLSQLLAEVQSNYKLEIDKSGTIIEADFTAADEVHFVKIYMQSILQNLISNAIKYRNLDKTNRISLRSYTENGTVMLIIQDNGMGIDMDKYGKDIFGLFKTFHTEEDSHGIGLYLVKKQIAEMEGDIMIQSAVGKGTTFTISFPV